jgi:hypothetical protein
MIAWILPLLLTAAPLVADGGGGAAPADQCASDPSFTAFREQLRQAIERRDRDRLLALVADDIRVSFGDTGGRSDFIQTWGLDRPETSLVWGELAEVLRLGCGPAEDGSLWAPNLGPQLNDEEDPFSTVMAVREGAVLRADADARSAVIAPLRWDVLTVQSDDGSDEWIPVRMRDGRSGFVHSEDVRSPLDYRAGFEKRGGRWQMTTLVAGD